ncbi:putative ATP-dependent RNA helicase DDX49 [Anabarilius grahami]|uniref:Probable ATP-dependent RNA helicase DDX49 n=1 Tax=Anabarilius grahami TaxID=495550 RepID=A0A3N0YCX9_ANAGA|nr:putative ATP-dependent RNA helicase DDX49 [Anabarilius grahami]
MATFETLGLHEWLIQQCKQMGISRPTPVQEKCIPAILEGRDCLGCAKTGSGKTAAFVLPVLQKLSEDPYGVFCLVLTPTRELAYQIAEQFRAFGKPLGLKDCIIVGGMDMVYQGLELSKKPHVVVATPGRLADHIRSSDTINLNRIQFLILDEADRLLEQGCTDFTKDLEVILSAVPAKRQTLLFSATLTDTLQQLQSIAMNRPFFWEHKSEVQTVEELDQRFILTPEKVKDAYLVQLIQKFQDEHDDWSIMIFTNTCKNCQILTMMLREFNFPTISLHSMMKQRQRFANLAKFKSNVFKILIATDVAARGLDIPTVQVVINHNTPGLPKIYIHRVGRTARAGRNGVSITLVTQYDIHLINAIEEQIQVKLKEFPVEEKEVLKILTQVNVTRRQCEISLESTDFDEKKKINKRKQMILEGKLPLSLLKTAQNHPMLVELKNGETYNGHLVSCDNWMNINLREVICTSRDGDKFWRMPECYIRGSTIKYLRIPDEIIDMVKEEVLSKGRGRGGMQQNKPQGKGRGGGPGRGGGAGRGIFGGRGRGMTGTGRGQQQEKKPGKPQGVKNQN